VYASAEEVREQGVASWITASQIERLPSLRAVFHAAGPVKHFPLPFCADSGVSGLTTVRFDRVEVNLSYDATVTSLSLA